MTAALAVLLAVHLLLRAPDPTPLPERTTIVTTVSDTPGYERMTVDQHDDPSRARPYAPNGQDPEPAVDHAQMQADLDRVTEATVLDRLAGLLIVAIENCGTTTRSDVQLAERMRVALGEVNTLARTLDGEHLTITAAAQLLADGQPLL